MIRHRRMMESRISDKAQEIINAKKKRQDRRSSKMSYEETQEAENKRRIERIFMIKVKKLYGLLPEILKDVETVYQVTGKAIDEEAGDETFPDMFFGISDNEPYVEVEADLVARVSGETGRKHLILQSKYDGYSLNIDINGGRVIYSYILKFARSLEDVDESESDKDAIEHLFKQISRCIEIVEDDADEVSKKLEGILDEYDRKEIRGMKESYRRRGHMLREGLLSQAKEEAEKRKSNGKIIQERAKEFLKVLKELYLHAGYHFDWDEAEWTSDNDLKIPYDINDEKTEKLVNELCRYGWISKWNKYKIWVKAKEFADDDRFETLMGWLS